MSERAVTVATDREADADGLCAQFRRKVCRMRRRTATGRRRVRTRGGDGRQQR